MTFEGCHSLVKIDALNPGHLTLSDCPRLESIPVETSLATVQANCPRLPPPLMRENVTFEFMPKFVNELFLNIHDPELVVTFLKFVPYGRYTIDYRIQQGVFTVSHSLVDGVDMTTVVVADYEDMWNYRMKMYNSRLSPCALQAQRAMAKKRIAVPAEIMVNISSFTGGCNVTPTPMQQYYGSYNTAWQYG